MVIPIEVSYKWSGQKRKKIRQVTGVICPTVLCQALGFNKVIPIYVSMGDVQVDWHKTSAGFNMISFAGE